MRRRGDAVLVLASSLHLLPGTETSFLAVGDCTQQKGVRISRRACPWISAAGLFNVNLTLTAVLFAGGCVRCRSVRGFRTLFLLVFFVLIFPFFFIRSSFLSSFADVLRSAWRWADALLLVAIN
jgi:hypothetical protein